MLEGREKIKFIFYFFIIFVVDTYALAKLADFDNNGKVNFLDLYILADNWYTEDINTVIDISGPEGISDGQVDFYDLKAFAEDYLAVKYIMSSHKSNNEKLYIWESYNGISWYLRGGNPVYENPNLPHTAPDPNKYPNNLMNCVRDPSIMKYNNKYYATYTTNNRPYHYQGNTIGIACSNDLQNWVCIGDVYCGSFSYTWAPEWFVDDDNSVHIFVSLNYKIYEIYPTNTEFTEWSVPVLVTGDFPDKIIDAFMIKIDGIYYLWYKDEGERMIEYATSTSLTSGYIVQKNSDWAGWGSSKEGECLVKIDENTWRIYFDYYVDHGIYYAESSDNFQTWTPKKLITSESFIPAHPTVIHFNE